MKLSVFGAPLLAFAAATGPAFAVSDTAAGYDPMALDLFIAKSLEAEAMATPLSAIDLFEQETPTVIAQDAQRFDAEGYLLGPDGKRISQPLLPRWRVGVFR